MISKSSAAISVEKSSSSGQPSKSALSNATLSMFDEKNEKRTATSEKSTINLPTSVPLVPPQRFKAQKGDIITLSLNLTPENDYIPEPLFDTTGIITFILGWGNYLPAIHSLLLDHQMSAGDAISNISIDAGWGEHNPNLVARIPRAAAEKFKLNYKSIQVGMELTLNQLHNMRVVVTNVTDSYFEVDANPPLAGASYECNFTVLNVERPTLYWEYHHHDDTLPVMSQEKHDENEVDENNVHTKCDEACCCCCRCHHGHVSDITAAAAAAATTTMTASSSDEIVSPPNHIHTNNNDNDNTTATATAAATSHSDTVESKYQVASFALGCFWGAELAFMRVPGVVGTKVGYTQGTISNPTYDEVCTGLTKHTEAVLMVYDPAVVTYEQLVRVALDRIKETTAVGNGYHRINTVGGKGIHDDDDGRNTQYRHGIYYHTNEQKEVACEMLRHMGGDHGGLGHFNVEVRRATVFYNAEDYHQQYLLKGGQSAKKGCTETIRCFG